MAEAFKDKRAVFPPRKQKLFLERVGKKLTIAETAHICNCSEHAVRDWRREKFSMPLAAVQALSVQTEIPIPKNIKTREAFAHNARAGKLGIAAVIKKYGRIPQNEAYRKEQWQIWWKSTGKFEKNPIFERKAVHKPKQTAKLAEFVGIMMGDGGISKYQAVVTLHHIDDLAYTTFVTDLIEKLFKVTPNVYHLPRNSVNNIVVSRKELVDYLHALGLPVGNKVKQQFDIPEWIKQNQKFSIACLRGLVDTDGCVFTHRYKAKGKVYAYKKLSFTSASEPLRQSVAILLEKLGFHPRTAGDDVRLDRVEDIKRYFSMISTHNQKHLRRYETTVG